MELTGYTFKGWAESNSNFTPSLIGLEHRTGREAYFIMIGDPLPLTITAMCMSRFRDELDNQPLVEIKVNFTDEDDGRIVTKNIGCYVTIADLEAAIASGQHDDLWEMWENCKPK